MSQFIKILKGWFLASLNNIAYSTDCCQRSTIDFQETVKLNPISLRPEVSFPMFLLGDHKLMCFGLVLYPWTSCESLLKPTAIGPDAYSHTSHIGLDSLLSLVKQFCTDVLFC